MGKFKPKKLGVTMFLSVVVILGIVAFADADNEFGVLIPPPQLTFFTTSGGAILTDFDDPTPIPSVACWMNVELKIKNQFGIDRGTEKSSFFKNNPTHVIQTNSLIDKDSDTTVSKEGSSYQVIPSIKCNTNKLVIDGSGVKAEGLDAGIPDDEQSDLFGILPLSLGAPLVVEENNLVVRIFAHNPDGTINDVYNSKIKVDEFDIFNTESRELGKIEIDPSLTTKFLREGTYDSEHKFAIEGFVLLHWRESENCIDRCSFIKFLIPIETVKTHNSDGKLTSITNPLMTSRTISVDLGEGEGGEDEDCNDNDTCEEDKGCPSGQTRVGGICRIVGDDGETCEDRDDCSEVSPITEIFDAFTTCLGSGDLTCVTNGQFLPFYLGGFGFLLLIGAVAQRGSRQPDIYGVPY